MKAGRLGRWRIGRADADRQKQDTTGWKPEARHGGDWWLLKKGQDANCEFQ
jgi:hypothetical protein